MSPPGNLFDQQRANRRRSLALVAAFLLFFAWIGVGGDLAFYLGTLDVPPGSYRHRVPLGGIATTLLGVGFVVVAWRRGPRQVLWASGAWELVQPSSDAERRFVNVVEEMAIASGLPRPSMWIVPDQDPNAFATGMTTDRSHVAVTEGLLSTLDRDELQAVVAHEMAHIRNDDVRLMTLLAALVGALALVADGTSRMMRSSGRRGGSRSRGGGKGNPLAVVVLVVWLVSVLLAPIVSRLLSLAVSRKRELLADATAAQFTRNPAALAAALHTIETAAAPTKSIKRGTAHLCIADPLGRRLTHTQGFLADLLATHPPMGLRVARLKAMAYQLDETGELPEAS